MGKRKRDREREGGGGGGDTEKDTETEKDRDRYRERQRQRDRERQRDTDRQTDRQTDRDRDRDRKRGEDGSGRSRCRRVNHGLGGLVVRSAPGQSLLVGCLTSQQQASVSQGRICSDNFTCCHTEIEVADQTFYLTQSQYTDTGPTSPSADPITPGAWQGSNWSANF